MAVDHKQLDTELCTSDFAALASNQTNLSSPQQSWMPSRSVGHQLMPPVMLVESTARLPMLAGHLVWSSAEQPMQSVRLAEGVDWMVIGRAPSHYHDCSVLSSD